MIQIFNIIVNMMIMKKNDKIKTKMKWWQYWRINKLPPYF